MLSIANAEENLSEMFCLSLFCEMSINQPFNQKDERNNEKKHEQKYIIPILVY